MLKLHPRREENIPLGQCIKNIKKTIMKGTITHNGAKRCISERKVKYTEKVWGLKGGGVMVLLDDQTDKVSPAQPFLAVAYVLSGGDH